MKTFTDRDYAILHDLSLVPYMLGSQIQAIHFAKVGDWPMLRRMTFLQEHGKVHQGKSPIFSGGRPEKLYSRKPLEGRVILPHMIDIVWTYVRITVATNAAGYTLEEWTLPSKRNEVGLIPDAFFIIATRERSYRFYAEVDEGTETLMSSREQKDIREKIEKYEQYIEGGVFEKAYGDIRCRVLFVINNLKRLQNIKATCEKVNVKHLNRYWLVTIDDLKTQDPFHALIWRRAGSDKLLSLI